LGFGERLIILLCKKFILARSKEVETGMVQFKTNLAEYSKEGYGSKRAVLLMMMMMIGQSTADNNGQYPT
jgi:hypothetical protein